MFGIIGTSGAIGGLNYINGMTLTSKNGIDQPIPFWADFNPYVTYCLEQKYMNNLLIYFYTNPKFQARVLFGL